ncbi:MAG: DNA/RNA helicase domain-containing protein [Terracidiphilus sp.]
MASFFRAALSEFLSLSDGEVIARLSVGYANRGYATQFSDQTLTWERDLRRLRTALTICLKQMPSASSWGVVLEFSIPRKEKRIDIVLLVGDQVVILEAKSGDPPIEARCQLVEYALLLHYFHKGTFEKRVIPILIAPNASHGSLDSLRQAEMFPQLAAYWINTSIDSRWEDLPSILLEIASRDSKQTDIKAWEEGPYYPVPSIIEAAIALRTGLAIREVAHSEASEHEIGAVRQAIQGIVDQAQERSEHAICFLTGVPGSGKTLVGLSLAHSEKNQRNAIHFMSGNGPLVKVLQHLFTQEGRRDGASSAMARTRAKTLIENVHVFARNYMEDDLSPPSNHAIIFDEAQRAWDRAQNLKKFKRDYSEPEMLLSIMERHHDWSVIVALVGGGQEINSGEAGLEEWGRALAARRNPWRIFASPEVLRGGASTAGRRLLEPDQEPIAVTTSDELHLRTSNRSLRAENLAQWVNSVVQGDADAARLVNVTARFPIFLTRSLNEMRRALRRFAIGGARFGLVGSSGAARLRAEGLEPSSAFHAEYPWEHWYLADRLDVRSSFRCEVFATEFEIQGLELDWIGLCWGGDFSWNKQRRWQIRRFLPGPDNRWVQIKNPERQRHRQNAYRVLLTRERQGMILFVPAGSADDASVDAHEFNATADFLLSCGVTPLQK